MDEPVHVTAPGGQSARCGATDGTVVRWEVAIDPAADAHFTCPACWRDAARGREPMGGSR